MAGVPVKKTRKRRARTQRIPRKSVPMPGPARNGSGRKRGQRRQRGPRNELPNSGNTKNFTIPIDEDVFLMSGTAGFGVTTFQINPGNPVLFPFASRIAQNFERYEFESLCFHYKPSVSVFAVGGQQGFVGFSATMDPNQAPPGTQTQADIMLHSPIVETAVPTSLSLPKSFLQSKSLREKYLVTQNGNLPGGADPNAYWCGQLYAWTDGQANTNQVGLVRVTGRCKLSNPALDTNAAALPNYSVSLFSVVNQATAATGVAFLVTFTTTNFNNNGVTLDGTNTIFTLPAGNYNVDWSMDLDCNTATAGIALVPSFLVNGASVSPQTSSTCPASATNTIPLHAPTNGTWFVRSNGATTVSLRAAATFTAGACDVDATIRFTTV